MSDAVTRADILSIADALYREGEKKGPYAHAEPYFAFSRVLRRALAAQPEPGAVPELPEYVTRMPDGASHRIKLKGPVSALWLGDAIADPDDLERIAEACTKLAARERARRAS